MTRKISAFGTLTGPNADPTADYIPIIDASVADASKNKRIILDELKTALGLQGRPPTTSLFSFTANGTGVTQSSTYDAGRGLSMARTDSGAAANRNAFLGKAVPGSTPWTATAKILVAPTVFASTIVVGGMAIFNSSSNKLITFGVQNLNGVVKLVASSFTDLNTFSADILATQIVPLTVPSWMRISDDGTTYTFQFSHDHGVTWFTFTTATHASFFTADKVGVVLSTGTVFTLKPTILVQHYDDPDFP